jgi:hypothetical protein
VGSYLTAHEVTSAYQEFQQLSAKPAALEEMIVTNTGEPSQRRAAEMLRAAQSTDVRTVQQIGRAAMAAGNVPAADYVTSLTTLLGCPDPKR